MTEIKNEKDVSVHFYKSPASYGFFDECLANISKEQADKLITMFESEKIPENSCIDGIEYYCTNATRGKKDFFNKKLYLTNFYFGGMKFPCAKTTEDKKYMDANNIHSVSSCFQHLTTGKCKCPFMANTVGKVLFPQFYDKQK